MEKYNQKSSYSYCLGESLAFEALRAIPEAVNEVVFSSRIHSNDIHHKILKLLEEKAVPYRIDDHLIEKLSLKENCYAIAFFTKFYKPLAGKRHLCLYGIDDFGDLGTIFRSAISFDYSDIVLIGKHPDYFDPRCVRSSMGSIFHLNIECFKDFSAYLKKYPYHLYALNDQGIALEDCQFSEPYSLVLTADKPEEDLSATAFSLKGSADKKLTLALASGIILNHGFHQIARDNGTCDKAA